MNLVRKFCLPLLLCLSGVTALNADDWGRFRGPHGNGISLDAQSIPTQWNDKRNLKWKASLPGPGASCPIVVGDRVFVTSWSGYATGGTELGQIENLKRHLICLDRATGQQRWTRTVAARLPEDAFRGMFTENGYATHTPVSDGNIVVAFFGKSGVHAYDMEGNPLWQANVGEGRDHRGWGTSSSPLLYKNLVIVPATIESSSLIALQRETGEVVWQQKADGFASTWGTPILIDSGARTELVLAVPYEIWSINPETGKLLWYCESLDTNSMCSSVVFHQGVLYAIESGPGGGGAIAVKPGGNGNVTDTHVLWKKNERSRISSPIVYDDKLYYFTSGIANCLDAKTGDKIYSERLRSRQSITTSTADNRRPSRGRRSAFGRDGGRGQDYSSPILVNEKLVYTRRSGDIYVIKIGDQFEQLAVNRFDSSRGHFHATPAASNGELFLRSSQTVYCVAAPR